MQDSFTSPDGFVCTSFPDAIVARPRLLQDSQPSLIILLPTTDIKLAWLPTYPTKLSQVPWRATQEGSYTAASLQPSIAPISWMPTLLGYLAAPRVHHVAQRFKADPLSGADMIVAAQMAWDPRQHPIVTRARLKETTAFFYTAPDVVITTGAECVELINVQGSVPILLAQDLTAPLLVDEGLTRPTLSPEAIC